VRYGSPGYGTTPQLSAEYLFKVLAKAEVMHVPYKGIPPLIQAVLAGEVEVAASALPPSVPLIKSGRMVGLAVTSATRSGAVPNVPTIAEAGFPGFEDDSWVGIWVPAGTPAPVIAKLRTELAAATASPDVREKLLNVGFDPGTMNPDAFSALVQKELRKWARVVKETGTKVE
jgi:tripartite-type tricarboxylate transporter receptor subunit TctC